MAEFANLRIEETKRPELSAIVTKLERGGVIPFVGAGISANNLNGSDDYAKVLAIAERELEHLEDKLQEVDDDAHQNFVAKFRDQYMPERKHKAHRSVSAPREVDGLLDSDRMRTFRVSLAKFIVHLTKRHNDAVVEQGLFYLSTFNPVVYVEGDKRSAGPNGGPKKDKYAAFDMLEELDKLNKDIRDRLAKSPNNLRLKTAHDLFKGAYDSLINRYQRSNGKRVSELLHVDHIIWFVDILWLTIVIWLPLYPTNRELAAELSLVSDRRTRTTERRLIRAAECFSNPELLTNYIARRFAKDFGEKYQDALVMDSHSALASAAVHASLNAHASGQAIIYTTNFDQGLELAMQAIVSAHNTKAPDRARGYRVVYPVLIENVNSQRARRKNLELEPTFDLVWVARDWVHSGQGGETIRWIVKAETNRLSENEKSTAEVAGLEQPYLSSEAAVSMSSIPDFSGPVIVKLHGAPLESLALLRARFPGELRHYLVVSEHQYIDTIIKSEATTPPWLTNVLKNRDISFIGYSIEDWNVRLHLARQPSGDRGRGQFGSKTNGDLNRSAIVRRPSHAEVGLFHRLGIGLAAEEISQLVRLINMKDCFKDLLDLTPFGDRQTGYLDENSA